MLFFGPHHLELLLPQHLGYMLLPFQLTLLGRHFAIGSLKLPKAFPV